MTQAPLTPALFRASAHALVFDASLAIGSSVEIPEDTHRHFHRVLRLRAGESVTVTDGNGTWRPTRVPSNFADASVLEADGDAVVMTRSAHSIAIGIAVPKGEKPELIVQKLTELGVDEIVFFPGDHSVARWDTDKIRKNFARLRLVSIEALQQSRGVFLPTLRWAAALSGVALGSPNGEFGESGEVAVFRADAGGMAPQLRPSQIVVVGPEGGWSPAEREIGTPISLAPTILRSETAAVVAAAFWVGLRSNHLRTADQG
jgi:16S rRNA (uracil1498-N3)-methyltransferase